MIMNFFTKCNTQELDFLLDICLHDLNDDKVNGF